VSRYLLDYFAKPMIIIGVAWLAAVVSRNGNGQPLIWALALAYVAFFVVIVGYLVVNANEVGLMANLGFAILLYTAAANHEGEI
jgi:hypothetical protein